MHRRLTTVLGLAIGAGVLPFASAQPAHAASAPAVVLGAPGVCPATPAAGEVTCYARVLTDHGEPVRPRVAGGQVVPAVPAGLGPGDIQSAYNLPVSSAGAGTVGIVDALDNPNAERDLAVYRSRYGLPPCTTANGCFRKRDQHGGTNYPAADAGWGFEITLDLAAASAACPACGIILVEAASTGLGDILTATQQAAALGSTTISLSLGTGEFSGETSLDGYFSYAGVSVFASAGDGGYGVSYPAASPHVIAVGGTSLSRTYTGARGWSEVVWGPGTAASPSGTGSGCSRYEPKPAWQRDPGCGNRTVNDVAAVADPATGFALYDTFGYGGWRIAGGTSLSSPLLAGMAARAGRGSEGTDGRMFAEGTSPLNDVTAGTDSLSGCSPSYLCRAGIGYDGPTGNGTPGGLPEPVQVAVPNPDPTVLAVRGSDGGLWVKYSPQGYMSYGGRLTAAPAIAAVGDGNHLYVALGADHQLWQRSDIAGWQPATPPGTYCIDNPAVWTDGAAATIACQGGDHALYANQGTVDGDGVFLYGGWRALGGTLTSGPGIAFVRGSVHYFVEGVGGRVWDRTDDGGYTGTGWGCVGHPSIATTGTTAFFACHGTDGREWTAIDTGAGWSAARPLGGGILDDSAVAAYASGATVYVAGLDGVVWSIRVDASGATATGWTFIGGRCVDGTAAAAQ